MNILVTGSCGGIGKWVVKRLLEEGHAVRAIDTQAQPLQPDFEYIPGDIRDLNLIRRAAMGMEAVIHLAAIVHDLERQDDLVLETNINGTWNVLLASQEAGVKRVVNFSSINALGHAEPNRTDLYLPLDDNLPHMPMHSYPLSKHVGEEMCSAFARRGVFSVVSLRPTLVLHPDPKLVKWWLAIPEEERKQFSTRDFWSYVDVRDVAEAAILSLTAPVVEHQAFLLSADDNIANTPTARIVEEHYQHLPWKTSPDVYLSQRETVSLIDCRNAKSVLGWQPKYSCFDPDAGYLF